MGETPRLLAVFAHPDDETFGVGPALATWAARGVETHLISATRGERGWQGDPQDNPGPEALGRHREGELRAAARELGVREVSFLGYLDGELDRAEPVEATAALVAHIRRIRPHVVVTFPPDGVYGHPDHIAISQLTVGALLCAADAAFQDPGDRPPHRVAKLYFVVDTEESAAPWRAAIGDLTMEFDGEPRSWVLWPRWLVSARVDGTAQREAVWRAFMCHASQIPPLERLELVFAPDAWPRWSVQSFYRAVSMVSGGRAVEDDLFEGLESGRLDER
ncbi:MAG: 1D-myo-inositol 2-acetamido-2-deoxy-alpha-D-glucopyranoside deacetylase [Chloroflexota bacterium]